jgi:catechol 2,3-dioxygenase-like lactoylglutathione lyase family enzyme
MLTRARVCATIATRDLTRAARFYAETLGLHRAYADERRGIYFEAGGGGGDMRFGICSNARGASRRGYVVYRA